MSETKLLTLDEVGEVGALPGSLEINAGPEPCVLLTVSQRDALCATVRALEARVKQCEGSRRVHELDNHHNAMACGYCAGPLKDQLQEEQRRNQTQADTIMELEAENTSLRSQLAAVTQENESLEADNKMLEGIVVERDLLQEQLVTVAGELARTQQHRNDLIEQLNKGNS